MQKRQLATIVFADIVGYTAMMHADEPAAIGKRSRFREVVEVQVKAHGGRIIQYYGDGCLILFDSGKEAVLCAIEVQSNLKKDAIPVRIGMHLGDVTYDDDGAYGDTVNIAARVESFAVPGAVFLSAKVHDQVHNQPEISCKSLGQFKMKNVTNPMEIFAVASEGFPVPEPASLEGKGEKEKSSIAVLAFTNMSNDPDQEYFGDGISEEIINALVKLPELKVAGRTSSFSFKGRDMDLREVGKQLDVATVLEGSIRKAGNRVRVTAQLINVEDGFHLWSERYDRELEDIFAIQDDIAQNISDKLKVTLLGQLQDSPLVIAPTKSVEAYEWYLRGRYFLDQRAHVQQATSCFEKARMLDPTYALAWSGLAYAHFYGVYFDGHQPTVNFPKVHETADRAIVLDPTLAEPHVMKALAQFYYDWDFESAAASYATALRLNPHASDTYRVKAYFHSMIGELEEGVRLAQKALDLDPLNINIRLSHGELLYRAKRFNEAADILEALLKEFPSMSPAYFMLGNCYYFLDQPDMAVETINRGLVKMHALTFYAFTGLAILTKFGQSEYVRQVYQRLSEQFGDKWISPVSKAQTMFSLGETAQAIALFQEGLADRDPVLMVMNTEPTWEEILDQPEVLNFLKELGLR